MQRQRTPAMPSRICASVGCGVRSSSAFAVRICPFWQKPQAGTCSSIQACCTGWSLLSFINPSSVVIAQAQGGGTSAQKIPTRKAKTTPLFKSPEGYPNAITATADGLWIGEQRTDNAHLVDWNGKVLKTVKTESKNTSGMAIGEGFVWMGANAAPQGIFQTDMTSKTISHRQIP